MLVSHVEFNSSPHFCSCTISFVQPAGAILQNVSAEALRHAAGLNGKKYNSDCALGAFKQANCSSSDTGQKLCEFARTAAQKRIVK